MTTLNLGIVAHVDAGKTSLTEQLLFRAGVIDTPGGVDSGNTQTDTDELERRRGITIRSAVVAVELAGLRVNLIDTPGHSDFIAEVERALAVLDAAVLVVSAVEGVQAQTRVLMRTLDRLAIPTVVFVNKIDRMGARSEGLIDDLRAAWSAGVVPLTTVQGIGTAAAAVAELAADRPEVVDLIMDQDDALLADYVRHESIDAESAVARQAADSLLRPLVHGSAITGAGVTELMAVVRRYLTPRRMPMDGAVRGHIFKLEYDRAGNRVAYLRMRSGSLDARDRVELHTMSGGHRLVRATAVEPFTSGATTEPRRAVAGDIAKVWGLRDAVIGDQLGCFDPARSARLPRPGLESVVTPADPSDRIRLHAALQLLAEQDPLINVRHDGGDISVSLYGEVQGQVLHSRLAHEFGVETHFSPAQIIYVEVPLTSASGVERMAHGTPFDATIGLRVDPTPANSGVTYREETAPGHMPVAFHRAIEESVLESLRQGPRGWPVTDCSVTLIERAYSPTSTGGDFRRLAPLVLATALGRAGTDVHEPLTEFEVDAPASALHAVLGLLHGARAAVANTIVGTDRFQLGGDLPAAEVYRVGQLLPGATQGDGAFLTRPGGHRKAPVRPPHHRRTDGNPYHRKEYLMFLAQS